VRGVAFQLRTRWAGGSPRPDGNVCPACSRVCWRLGGRRFGREVGRGALFGALWWGRGSYLYPCWLFDPAIPGAWTFDGQGGPFPPLGRQLRGGGAVSPFEAGGGRPAGCHSNVCPCSRVSWWSRRRCSTSRRPRTRLCSTSTSPICLSRRRSWGSWGWCGWCWCAYRRQGCCRCCCGGWCWWFSWFGAGCSPCCRSFPCYCSSPCCRALDAVSSWWAPSWALTWGCVSGSRWWTYRCCCRTAGCPPFWWSSSPHFRLRARTPRTAFTGGAGATRRRAAHARAAVARPLADGELRENGIRVSPNGGDTNRKVASDPLPPRVQPTPAGSRGRCGTPSSWGEASAPPTRGWRAPGGRPPAAWQPRRGLPGGRWVCEGRWRVAWIKGWRTAARRDRRKQRWGRKKGTASDGVMVRRWGMGGLRTRARELVKLRVVWEMPKVAHQAVEGTSLIITEGGGGGRQGSGGGSGRGAPMTVRSLLPHPRHEIPWTILGTRLPLCRLPHRTRHWGRAERAPLLSFQRGEGAQVGQRRCGSSSPPCNCPPPPFLRRRRPHRRFRPWWRRCGSMGRLEAAADTRSSRLAADTQRHGGCRHAGAEAGQRHWRQAVHCRRGGGPVRQRRRYRGRRIPYCNRWQPPLGPRRAAFHADGCADGGAGKPSTTIFRRGGARWPLSCRLGKRRWCARRRGLAFVPSGRRRCKNEATFFLLQDDCRRAERPSVTAWVPKAGTSQVPLLDSVRPISAYHCERWQRPTEAAEWWRHASGPPPWCNRREAGGRASGVRAAALPARWVRSCHLESNAVSLRLWWGIPRFLCRSEFWC